MSVALPTEEDPVRDHGDVVSGHLLATFATSWSLWGAALLLDGSAWAAPLRIAGTFGPALAALGMLRVRGGRPAVVGALRSHVRWRGTGASVVVAAALPPTLIALALAADLGLGGTWNVELPPLPAWPVVVAFVLVLGGPLGEELGWRGHLLPALERRHGPVMATALVGIAWVTWHAPLFLMADAVQSQVPVWLFAWQIVATSFLYTWLRHRDPHSLVPALVLHTSFNVSVGIGLIGPDGPSTRAMVIALALATLVAARLAATATFRHMPEAMIPHPRPDDATVASQGT